MGKWLDLTAEAAFNQTPPGLTLFKRIQPFDSPANEAIIKKF
jgi:hypothetical protein